MDDWEKSKNHDFITDAGWFFKTLAAQEPGKKIIFSKISMSQKLFPTKDVSKVLFKWKNLPERIIPLKNIFILRYEQ